MFWILDVSKIIPSQAVQTGHDSSDVSLHLLEGEFSHTRQELPLNFQAQGLQLSSQIVSLVYKDVELLNIPQKLLTNQNWA